MIENTVLQISLPASAVSFASLFVGGTHCVQSVVAMSRTGIDCHSFSSGKTPEAIRCALNPQFLLYPGKKLFVETISAFSIEVGADRPGFPQLFYLRPRNVCTANDRSPCTTAGSISRSMSWRIWSGISSVSLRPRGRSAAIPARKRPTRRSNV